MFVNIITEIIIIDYARDQENYFLLKFYHTIIDTLSYYDARRKLLWLSHPHILQSERKFI